MSFRLTTLLCLTGLAACSHSPETAKDATDFNQPTLAANDSSVTRASLDDNTTPSTPATATSLSSRDSNLRAPVIADTRGTSPNDSHASPTAEPLKPAELSPGVAPDNTKVNKRDNNSAALTPMDQNNNQTDLKITQQIRQAVMADGSLSFTAKNVKIITQNGKVTLRGPVNNAQERTAIENAARKVAGTTEIDNQLEVKK